jgi:tetratricopeptide (TPR) repeat protein
MLELRSIKSNLVGGLLAVFATISAQASTLCSIPSEADASACEAAVYLDGDDTTQLLDCNDSLLKQERHADALLVLTNGLSVYTNASQLLRQRGRAWFSKGDFSCALLDITAAIEIEPDNHQGYYFRGITFSFQKQPSLALAELNRAIELNPKYSNTYLFRAISYEQLNDLERAYSDVRRYLSEFPDNLIGNRIMRRIEEGIEMRKGFGCAMDAASCG